MKYSFVLGLLFFGSSCQKPAQTSTTDSETSDVVLFKEKKILFKLVEENSFESIKSDASMVNKIIFVDVYADWCGPSKHMDANVFNKSAIADRFNNSFINYKVDAEGFDGYNVALKYNVRSYPTYLFLKPDGEVLYRLEGVFTAEGMLEEADFAQSLYH
jgi:thiol:disulfide interchange protein